MSALLGLLLSVAAAETLPAAPTAGAWQAAWGAPTRSLADAERARTEGEPLLVYWMSVRAAPLGVGPALPGTLVANFDAAAAVEAAELRDFTFLAVASVEETAALTEAVAPWITGRRRVERDGGTFEDLTLALPDGRGGTISVRQGAATASMADGRPAPSLWMHVGALPAAR